MEGRNLTYEMHSNSANRQERSECILLYASGRLAPFADSSWGASIGLKVSRSQGLKSQFFFRYHLELWQTFPFSAFTKNKQDWGRDKDRGTGANHDAEQ